MTISNVFLKQLRHRVHVLLHPRRKMAFIYSIAKHGRVLDVGCGNDSPEITKRARPDIVYTGLDVCDYEQAHSVTDYADEYRIVSPENFTAEIGNRPNSYDAAICSHNLEHCMEPEKVLSATLKALKKNGIIYLAFPCAESVRFPSRQGTLNFYDDKTHVYVPQFSRILDTVRQHGCEITFARERYRPWRLFLIGLVLEPVSAIRKKVIRGTWSFYGFESIIWARKI
ncbi:MAG: class I SAM-dependent methyltransferase [Acidobacteriaceae bacterium]